MRGCGCGNNTCHLSGAKKNSHKHSIYSCGYSGKEMAFTADQVLDLLDSTYKLGYVKHGSIAFKV